MGAILIARLACGLLGKVNIDTQSVAFSFQCAELVQVPTKSLTCPLNIECCVPLKLSAEIFVIGNAAIARMHS